MFELLEHPKTGNFFLIMLVVLNVFWHYRIIP